MIATTTLVTLLSAAAVGQYTNEIDSVYAGVRFELLAGSTLTDLYDLSPADPMHPIRGPVCAEVPPLPDSPHPILPLLTRARCYGPTAT